ncbi:FHA domain-containing protein [Cognatilysobacter lacus]|uniref:FHA domain-containing protein n=1 Tax=Cognatilysobacter lacus TaxID=1643323 RepID=UPI0016595D03|nr:FHA domain-containing protein [Lysobacter lacus]
MTALRLRPTGSERDLLDLEPGVHPILPSMLDARQSSVEPVGHVYVDSRGVWLQVGDGVRGVYVNGRPIRRMAMLRAGDSIFMAGVECVLIGRRPESGGEDSAPRSDVHAVLRAIAGRHHGRCFPLERECVLGRAPDCEIPIDDEAIGAREVSLRVTAKGVRATSVTPSAPVWVNGHALGTGLLVPGDQLVVAGQHRFVVEAARASSVVEPERERRPSGRAPSPPKLRRAARRLPWLIVAAVMLAGALSLLLLYGAG